MWMSDTQTYCAFTYLGCLPQLPVLEPHLHDSEEACGCTQKSHFKKKDWDACGLHTTLRAEVKHRDSFSVWSSLC